MRNDETKCKSCGGELVKRATQKKPSQLKKAFYYTAYYFCPKCHKLYHNDKFKVENYEAPLLPLDGFDNKKDYDVQIWTDGACVFNGHVNAKAAWAFVTEEHSEGGLVEGKQTNNVAEAMAIYHALKWAAGKGYKKIKIHSDSQISINNLRKDPERIKENTGIFRDISRVIRENELQVDFEKVLGHSGDINNEKADKLANGLASG